MMIGNIGFSLNETEVTTGSFCYAGTDPQCIINFFCGAVTFVLLILNVIVTRITFLDNRKFDGKRIMISYATALNFVAMSLHYFFFSHPYFGMRVFGVCMYGIVLFIQNFSIIVFILVCDYFARIATNIFKQKYIERFLSPIKYFLILYSIAIFIYSIQDLDVSSHCTCMVYCYD